MNWDCKNEQAYIITLAIELNQMLSKKFMEVPLNAYFKKYKKVHILKYEKMEMEWGTNK